VLERTGDGFAEFRHSKKMLIIPNGKVTKAPAMRTKIINNDSCDSMLQFFKYEIHPRFGVLVAGSIRARLHLASLHASTSSLFPDRKLGMTGEERAIELVRQCWVTRPFSMGEVQKLDNLKFLNKTCPTLSLLCYDVERNAERLQFLYVPNLEDDVSAIDTSRYTDCDEWSAYLRERQLHVCSSRIKLTQVEEWRCCGNYSDMGKERSIVLPLLSIPHCREVESSHLKNLEQRLSKLLMFVRCDEDNPNYPLSATAGETKLEQDMLEELHRSWLAHRSTLVPVIKSFASGNDFLPIDTGTPTCAVGFKELFHELKEEAYSLESELRCYILSILNSVWLSKSVEQNHYTVRHDLLRLANSVPLCTLQDLGRIAGSTSVISDFNPLLTEASKEYLFDRILLWLQLCVFQDKMERLCAMVEHDCVRLNKALIQELQTTRGWNVKDYPSWLVFEVEGRLQIRPEQFAVAQHLMNHPGDIMQLNMGCGKTRIILPILALHWTSERLLEDERVVRMHFLSPLFDEAFEVMHNTLCASVLSKRIYTLPFCRDVRLNATRLKTIERLIADSRNECGVFLVKPEHRLSLELKQKELYLSCVPEEKMLSSRLHALIKKTSWRDVFDEIDEILHNRFQLIYAVGCVDALPDGHRRWNGFQALLETLCSDKVSALLTESEGAVIYEASMKQEAFPLLRLIDGEQLDSLKPRLKKLLVDSLLKEPPYTLMWMRDHPLQVEISHAMTDTSFDPDSLSSSLPVENMNDVLALRGMLAEEILFHNLLKRHRVNYGVARPGKKRIAIPFRGADSPSERSEFAHPDMAICATILSYYEDGLDKNELKEAIEMLFRCGLTAQKKIYKQWLELSSIRMRKDDEKVFNSLNKVEKIDLSNAPQQQYLLEYFSRNRRTINFWLNNCVFPVEMQQYPQRLSSNAWHLAFNRDSCVVGFSGTNDNHRLLPLQVRQYFAEDGDSSDLKGLFATNGKMLDVIVENTLECLAMNEGLRYQSIIDIIRCRSSEEIRALIDCGAVLAGISNYQAATEILTILPRKEFQGVVFYDDTDSSHGIWKILERNGRLLPKNQSPIREQACFALFDEPRCRGSDLKLPSNAIALLTLGPKMSKDKLMQAAGRMRQLGRNQKISLIGGKDIFGKLEQLSGGNKVTASTVLRWVTRNSVEANAESLLSWTYQGILFASTLGRPESSVEDELLTLKQFYGNAVKNINVAEAAKIVKTNLINRVCGQGKNCLSEYSQRYVENIMEKVSNYGVEFYSKSHGTDEECERELELEQEEEEEIEVEVPSMNPRAEVDWNFSSIFNATTPLSLPTKVVSLGDFIASHLQPKSLSKINWSNKVFCTENFAYTITETNTVAGNYNNFLRLVDSTLKFRDGSFLLLSEREADSIIHLFWHKHKSDGLSTGVVYAHHSFVRLAAENKMKHGGDSCFLALPCSSRRNPKVQQEDAGVFQNFLNFKPSILRDAGSTIDDDDALALVSLQLFAGETMFNSKARMEALIRMLYYSDDIDGSKIVASNEPEYLVVMRGYIARFAYSDLELVCKEIARKACVGFGTVPLSGEEN